MTTNEKQLRGAMLEQARIAGVLAEKRTEFETSNAALKQRRIEHNKLAAGVALGEAHDVVGSQKALDKAMTFVGNLGAVLDGIEERLPAANETLRYAIEQYEESLRLEDNQLREALAEEWRTLVETSVRPVLLRMLARTYSKSDCFSYGISAILNLRLPGLFSTETDLLQFRTQKFNPETQSIHDVAPFEDDPELMKLAKTETASKTLLADARRQLPINDAIRNSDAKTFSVMSRVA